MALIKCPECGKEISDTAKNCIHCGYVLKEENNVTQPQTIVIAPQKGGLAKKSLNKGVTILLIVVSFSLAMYLFGWLLSGEVVLPVSDWPQLNYFINGCVTPAIISIVMAILIFALPKLRKIWFEIIYILISIAVLPLTLSFVVTTLPAVIAYVVGAILIIKSMFIKD